MYVRAIRVTLRSSGKSGGHRPIKALRLARILTRNGNVAAATLILLAVFRRV